MPGGRRNGVAASAASASSTFVDKLWEVVNDPSAQAVLSFTSAGDAIAIHDEAAFTAELLPRVCNSTSLNR
jgi:hypothetical protein